MPVKMRGQDTVDGLRAWIMGEIQKAPGVEYDLGKFFFSVSSGMLGIVMAIQKFGVPMKSDIYSYSSLIFLMIAIFIALFMVMPNKMERLNGATDLVEEYQRCVRGVIGKTWLWFFTWALGVVLGFYHFLL